MAVTDEKEGALATVAAAAAAGAGVYALRKALASGGGSSALARRDRGDDHDDDGDGDGDERENGSRSRSALLDTVWDSASDAVVPMAEEAADAAGKWLAENSPDVIRERIIPRFIESFSDAA
jgi:hypothetical protein